MVRNNLCSRCSFSTFKKKTKPILDILSQQSRDELSNAGILALYSLPDISQNIPLLITLFRSYSIKKRAFLLGNTYAKFTVNHTALILGLPNFGQEFCFSRFPFSTLEQKDILAEMMHLSSLEWSEATEADRIKVLIKDLLCKLFFPLQVLKIPACLEKIKDLEDFRRYNWPKAVHTFLHSQFLQFSQRALDNKPLGYFEGCSTLLVVWFFEITKINMWANDLARPRLCRWPSNVSLSSKFCSSLGEALSNSDMVKSTFDGITPSEEALLEQDNTDHDLNEKIVEISMEKESENEKKRKKNGRMKMRIVRGEMKKMNEKLDTIIELLKEVICRFPSPPLQQSPHSTYTKKSEEEDLEKKERCEENRMNEESIKLKNEEMMKRMERKRKKYKKLEEFIKVELKKLRDYCIERIDSHAKLIKDRKCLNPSPPLEQPPTTNQAGETSARFLDLVTKEKGDTQAKLIEGMNDSVTKDKGDSSAKLIEDGKCLTLLSPLIQSLTINPSPLSSAQNRPQAGESSTGLHELVTKEKGDSPAMLIEDAKCLTPSSPLIQLSTTNLSPLSSAHDSIK